MILQIDNPSLKARVREADSDVGKTSQIIFNRQDMQAVGETFSNNKVECRWVVSQNEKFVKSSINFEQLAHSQEYRYRLLDFFFFHKLLWISSILALYLYSECLFVIFLSATASTCFHRYILAQTLEYPRSRYIHTAMQKCLCTLKICFA